MSTITLGVLFVFSIVTQAVAQEIKITLLGTGNPIPTLDRFGPSALVEADANGCSSTVGAERRNDCGSFEFS